MILVKVVWANRPMETLASGVRGARRRARDEIAGNRSIDEPLS